MVEFLKIIKTRNRSEVITEKMKREEKYLRVKEEFDVTFPCEVRRL